MAIFGKTTVGTMELNCGWGSALYLCRQIVPETGIITKLTDYIYYGNTGNGKGVIFSDDATNNRPLSLLAEGTEFPLTGWTWGNSDINCPVIAGQVVWIGIFMQNNVWGRGDAGAVGQTVHAHANWAYPTVPQNYIPIVNSVAFNAEASVYATYTANTSTTYNLTVNPSVGGDTNPTAGIYTYNAGEAVTVTATANNGYNFTGWNLDGVPAGTTTSITVDMNADHTLTATFTLVGSIIVNPCDTAVIGGNAGNWQVSEGGGGQGRSTIRLNTSRYTTAPASVELVSGMGAWGVWYLWRAYKAYGPPMEYLDLSQTPVLEFDVESDLQQTPLSLTFGLICEDGSEWGSLNWGKIQLTSAFQKISIDLRLTPDMKIPDLTKIAYFQFVIDSGNYNQTDITTRIDNITAKAGQPIALVLTLSPKAVKVLPSTQVTFSSVVAGGTAPYTYEWKMDGIVVGTNATCTISAPSGVGDHPLVITVRDAVGAQLSNTATVTVYALQPPPNNPTPWHTVGHKIIDANGNEVYLRSIGTNAGELQSISGMWTGIGEPNYSWSSKWVPIDSTLSRKMSEVLNCMRTNWYCNAVRVQGVVAEWWWADKINPYQRYGEGPNSLMSYRDYWEMLAQVALQTGMTVVFSMPSVFSYYEGATTGAGGQPGNLTAQGKTWMDTINTNEMVAWGEIWKSIVQRMGVYPNLMWELWNEPNSENPVAKQNYFTYVIEMYKAIRGTGDNHLILIQWDMGVVPNWAGELSWVAEIHQQLKTAIGHEPVNIVYTTHCYRSPWNDWNGNSGYKMSYTDLFAQMTSPTMIPITRSATIDVPLYISETGVFLSGMTQQEINDDLVWFDSMLKICRELGVGINPEFWMPTGVWGQSEALLQAGSWVVGTPTPTPTVTGQKFIDASVPQQTTLIVDAGGPYTAEAGKTVSFSATVTGGSYPYTYEWVFGDGTTSTEQNPTHVYTQAGDYNATLTVTDNLNESATDSAQVKITTTPIQAGFPIWTLIPVGAIGAWYALKGKKNKRK